jgi:putative MATE family efflux protein
VLGEQALNALVTWNDAFLAGRISAEATGAVGVAGYIGWLMTMLFWMADMGAAAIVARAVGAGDDLEARRATNQACLLAIALGAAGTLMVQLAAPGFARLLNMHGPAEAIAVGFMRIDSLGYTGASISFALAACLRGAGDTRTPLIVLGGVNVVNCVVTWLLTFGAGPLPACGVAGIAWGTVIARWSGAAWMLAILQRRGAGRRPRPAGRESPAHRLRLHAGLMRPDGALLWRILRVGVPAAADGALTFTGHFVFMTIVTRVPSLYPPAVLYAAHIVGIRIESLSYLPATAWAVAAATIVGQNHGARQPDRARLAARTAARQAAVLLACTGALYLIAAGPLFAFLSGDAAVGECGRPALRALGLVQVPLAFLIVYLGALRGAGDTRVPMVITAVGMALLRLPVSWFGGFVLQWGLVGAWLGMFTDIVVRAALVSRRFRSGAWQRVRV